MARPAAYAAVDLGAGSGRVVLGSFAGGRIFCEVVHRFQAPFRAIDGHDRWPFEEILRGVQAGLRAAGERARAEGMTLRSVGVDSWGVDYGWLDGEGRLLADPICYRDARTEGVLERLFRKVPRTELYERTGIQYLPINTLVQLFAEHSAGERPAGARSLLMMADLVHHALCGSMSGEVTNASTTQLWNPKDRKWDEHLAAVVGMDADRLPRLLEPGTALGTLRPELAREAGLREIAVVAPATHDTASAVAGTPLSAGTAYLSSGTWSLLGVELLAPVLSAAARTANFTNEAGVGGTTRFLRNAMGLWLLEGIRASAARAADPLEYDRIDTSVHRQAPGDCWVDPDDLRFLNPADMAAEVRAALEQTGQRAPNDFVTLARCVLQSLALRYAQTIREIEKITNYRITEIRVVGGGSKNDFLNQATADATGRVVKAGPVEATALGNLLVQAIADEEVAGLAAGRKMIAEQTPCRVFEPQDSELWLRAREEFDRLTRPKTRRRSSRR